MITQSKKGKKMAKCGKKCEVFSRVVGYVRPISNWNEGKKEEYSQRKEFNVKKSLNHKINN